MIGQQLTGKKSPIVFVVKNADIAGHFSVNQNPVALVLIGRKIRNLQSRLFWRKPHTRSPAFRAEIRPSSIRYGQRNPPQFCSIFIRSQLTWIRHLGQSNSSFACTGASHNWMQCLARPRIHYGCYIHRPSEFMIAPNLFIQYFHKFLALGVLESTRNHNIKLHQ